jgi:hypothetical protein
MRFRSRPRLRLFFGASVGRPSSSKPIAANSRDKPRSDDVADNMLSPWSGAGAPAPTAKGVVGAIASGGSVVPRGQVHRAGALEVARRRLAVLAATVAGVRARPGLEAQGPQDDDERALLAADLHTPPPELVVPDHVLRTAALAGELHLWLFGTYALAEGSRRFLGRAVKLALDRAETPSVMSGGDRKP